MRGLLHSPPFLLVYLCANVGPQCLPVVRLPAPLFPHSASLGPATATQVLSAPVPVSAPPTSLDVCLFFISLVSDFLAVRFSVSSGCARRRSVSTYAAILVLPSSLLLLSLSPSSFLPSSVFPFPSFPTYYKIFSFICFSSRCLHHRQASSLFNIYHPFLCVLAKCVSLLFLMENSEHTGKASPPWPAPVMVDPVSILPSHLPSQMMSQQTPDTINFIHKYFSFFKKDFFNLFLERGEREGEKHRCMVASLAPPIRDLDHNPGMCPDWELNWRPFGSQACAQSTEPHQPGLFQLLYTQSCCHDHT